MDDDDTGCVEDLELEINLVDNYPVKKNIQLNSKSLIR